MTSARLCRCPFCFGQFAADRALFKAATVFEKMDEKTGMDVLFNKRTDRKLDAFRKKFPGTDWHGNDLDDDDNYDDHVLLCTKEDQVSMPLARTEEGEVDFTDFDAEEKDVVMLAKVDPEERESGYISSVKDRFDQKTTVRVCPHCHNRLPREFGKYETKYIAVVGITSSGKTVYLSQLFKNIDKYLAHADMVRLSMNEEMDQFVKNHPVKAGERLPQGTGAAHFTMPIPIVVMNSKTNMRYMMIFYDIAGENCINPEQMSKFGAFICNSDGVILITDPKQLNELIQVGDNSEEEEDVLAPGRVLNAMYDAFLADMSEKKDKKIPPVAAAISKSDMLDSVMDESSYVFRNTDYEKYEGNGFAYDDFNNVNMEINRLMGKTEGNVSQGGIYKKNLEANFSNNYAFFAFSALNCEVPKDSDEELQESPKPLRLEDPLIWLMYRMGMVSVVRKKGLAPQNDKGGFFGKLFGKK